MKLSLGREAVLAVQIAGVGHMEAEGLDHGAAVLEVECLVGVGVLREQLPRLGQSVDIRQTFPDLFPGIAALQKGFRLRAALSLVQQGDGIVGQLVHGVDAAAVDVQNDIVSV